MTPENRGLRHTVSGQGDPVVLLDWTPWESRALADALAARYRVVSVEPPVDHAAADVTLAVAQTAAEAGLQTYTLVGTSVGADVALRVALANAGPVDTLVLVSPTCVRPTGRPAAGTPEQARDSMLAHPDDSGQPLPGSRRTAALAALAERLRAAEGDAEEILRQLTCATLVVFGQEDQFVARTAGGVWKDRVPNCSLSYVYDAGHAVGMDRPDALHNVVLDFAERRETFIVENRVSLINP